MPGHAALGVGVRVAFHVLKNIQSIARKTKGRVSAEERDRIARYLRFLDERRVLFVHFNVEVVECCVGSLGSLQTETERTLADVTHPVARAALGGILDTLRGFLDRWRGFRPDREGPPWRLDGRPWHMRGEQQAEFFCDLGALRLAIVQVVDVLVGLDPALKTPASLGAPPDE